LVANARRGEGVAPVEQVELDRPVCSFQGDEGGLAPVSIRGVVRGPQRDGAAPDQPGERVLAAPGCIVRNLDAGETHIAAVSKANCPGIKDAADMAFALNCELTCGVKCLLPLAISSSAQQAVIEMRRSIIALSVDAKRRGIRSEISFDMRNVLSVASVSQGPACGAPGCLLPLQGCAMMKSMKDAAAEVRHRLWENYVEENSRDPSVIRRCAGFRRCHGKASRR
jgi:hypothetical protein